MRIAITIEGQRGLTWQKWVKFAPMVEAMGFDGLYRSDHFFDAEPPDRESLELWVSLAWLADHTNRMEFGPLVTPFSFRHPVHTARMAKDLDILSRGRFVLGVGAGWGGGVREHEMFGFELLSVAERFTRFEEGLEVVTRLLHTSQKVSFTGKYYRLKDAHFLPPASAQRKLPVLIGGNGKHKLLPLAARYADEWNAIYRTPEQFKTLNEHLNQLLKTCGRKQSDVTRSQMLGMYLGTDQRDLNKVLADSDIDGLHKRGILAGCSAQIIDQLGRLSLAGVEKVIIQWQNPEDIRRLEHFAKEILPQAKNL